MSTPKKTSAALKALKTTTDTSKQIAQQSVRRFTATLTRDRDRSLCLPPKSKVAVQVVVNDTHNALKTHVFKIYPCRHCVYQQAINGRFFYPSFVRVTKSMPYYSLLTDALGPEGITTIAWHLHKYGKEGLKDLLPDKGCTILGSEE